MMKLYKLKNANSSFFGKISGRIHKTKIANYLKLKMLAVYCKLRRLGPNSVRKFYQTLARTQSGRTLQL